MVKLVEHHKLYGKSVNFIDANGVYLGYDDENDTSCCETVGWFISDAPDTPYTYALVHCTDMHLLEGYTFVPPALIEDAIQELSDSDLDEGGHVSFMLAHPDKPYKYIHLYNSHNGYYGHEALLVIDGGITHFSL